MNSMAFSVHQWVWWSPFFGRGTTAPTACKKCGTNYYANVWKVRRDCFLFILALAALHLIHDVLFNFDNLVGVVFLVAWLLFVLVRVSSAPKAAS